METLVSAFENQVRLFPGKTIVRTRTSSFSYDEINRQANKLSRLLMDALPASASGQTVGILFGKEPASVAAILGTLKAGQVYMPMDASYPVTRLQKMMQDTGCRILITCNRWISLAEELKNGLGHELKIINTDEIPGNVPEENLCLAIGENQAAYILFTSGSTDKPKGIRQSHRNVLFFANAYIRYNGISADDKLTYITAYSHDGAVMDLYASLLSGATMYPVDPKEEKSFDDLLEWFSREKITVWHSVPTLISHIGKHTAKASREHIRLVVFGGEPVTAAHIRNCKLLFEAAAIYNLYGQTESSFSAGGFCGEEDNSVITIGTAVDGMNVFLVDEEGEEVGDYETGELLLAGPYIAPGYYNADEKENSRFREDDEFGRLFWTGDLGIRLPDGKIKFAGRKDNQVKIRGNRVELGEIEETILGSGEAEQAVAVSYDNDAEEKNICVYAVLKPGGSVESIFRFTRQNLPDYMRPAQVIAIPEMPLTSSGKIDRKALPDPAAFKPGEEMLPVASSEEKKLQQIWSDILGIDAALIYRNVSFFRLGGHSLNAMLLAGRIHREFGTTISLLDIFELETIEQLAGFIRQAQSNPFQLIPVSPVSNYYPVTSAQKRVYVLQQLNPEGIAYNMPMVIELSPGMEKQRIRETFARLLERHESLRTSFDVIEEKIVQKVQDRAELFFEEYSAAREEIQELQNKFVRPFRLNETPLVRVAYTTVSNGNDCLLVDMHHIITDGISNQQLAADFLALYNGETLPELKLHYRDYAVWINSDTQQQRVKEQQAYWLSTFAGELPVLTLPYDFSRPVVQGFEGASVSFGLPEEEYNVLKKLCREHDITVYMALLAAMNIWLSRLSTQEDIIVGSPVASRRHPDLEKVVGMFVNTLVMRNAPSGNKTLREFIGEVKLQTLRAYDNQEYPFEELLEQITVARDTARNPLFDVSLTMQNQEDNTDKVLGDGKISAHVKSRSKFDISLYATEKANTILFSMDYSTKLFREETINRFIGYFRNSIKALAADASAKICELEILDSSEKRQLLFDFNETATAYPAASTIQELFEEQVRQRPDSIALSSPGISYTYKELNSKCNQFANYLRKKHQVKKGDLVAVGMERSADTVVAIMGILKAGAAYLPLNTDFPQARIDYMIADSNCSVVIDDAEFRSFHSRRAVYDNKNPEPVNDCRDLAYVIYTSGSTGKPKGVMTEHRGVARLVKSVNYMQILPEDKFLCVSSFSFDASVFDVFASLLNGAQLVVQPKELLNVSDLEQAVERNGITILFATTALFNSLVDNDFTGFARLKHVLFGGEQVSLSHVLRFIEKFPAVKLLHFYGPSENSVYSTYYEITADAKDARCIPIGKPVSNSLCYLLDAYGNPVPPGTTGEICVGGDGLARGYLNREELTAEKFVSNPFLPGTLMYRTGDLGRMLPDGNVEFAGRKDNQVKLRGFRVELGEIENHLKKFEGIRDALVLLRGEGEEKALCAYYAAAAEVDPAVLRAHLRAQLPDYMVPLHFVRLEKLPVNAQGKVDKKALPDPVQGTTDEYAAPRTPEETILASIWQDVLGVKTIGIDTDYFALGGDSIKAIRLLSRINKELGADLRIVDVYTFSNIRLLAQRIGQSTANEKEAVKAEVENWMRGVKEEVMNDRNREDVEDAYPMSDIEKGLVYHYEMYKGSGMYHDQYLQTIRFGEFDEARFHQALALMTEKHSILRTSFNLADYSVPVNIVHRKGVFPVTHEDLTGLSHSEQTNIIRDALARDVQNFIQVNTCPAWRVITFRLDAHHVCLLFVFHHAVLDGWSWSSFITELHECYLALKTDPGHKLQPLKSSYRDVIVEEYIEKKSSDSHQFWKNELAGYSRYDFCNAGESSPYREAMSHYNYDIGSELLGELRNIARQYSVGMKDICIAAYYYMLYMFSGTNDIVAGIVNNIRPEKEDGDKILGCFLNTIPVRIKVPAGVSWIEFVMQVKHKLLELKAHERLSLNQIAVTTGEKNRNGNPFFDVILNYTDFHVKKQMTETPEIRYGAAEFSIHADNSEGTNTIFDFEVDVTAGKIFLHPKYYTSVVSESFVQKACMYYETILAQIAFSSNEPAAKARVLPQEERGRILEQFNDTKAAYSSHLTMTGLFEAQAQKNPGATAVLDGADKWTYAELNDRANQLAKMLRQQGVQRQDFVAIAMDRQMEMVAAVLAVLKAGAIYVPMEPSLPSNRLSTILAAAGCKSIITNHAHLEKIAAIANALPGVSSICCADAAGTKSKSPVLKHAVLGGADEIAAMEPGNLDIETDSEDIAYVIFTSGSTGVPKGVVVKHRPVINLVEWVNKTFGVNSSDRLLFVTSLSFDLSVYDIFGTLAAGGSVRVASGEEQQNPEKLFGIIKNEHITFWDSAPAALQQVAACFNENEPADESKLRLVFLSGDWIPVSLPDKVRAVFRQANVVSLGGATEATIWSNFYPVGKVDPAWPSIPYGKPIQNARYYILDAELAPVPIGVAGDLLIGGDCLAEGYLGDQALTDAKFIPDPYNKGKKMYRTGDIARWFEDGNMEFLGRKDFQVKIRGYRVELGEIESLLLKYKGVKDAIVHAHGKRTDKVLCAYYVSGEALEASALRSHLAALLPEYMVPSFFMRLDTIPVTPNGKVDRKALPEPQVSSVRHLAPEGPVEEKLAAIWSEVLSLDKDSISADSDFFELGGHSLRATVLASKIQKELNVKIPLAEIFRLPTIRSLAASVKEAEQETYYAISPAQQKEHYELSPAQKRLFVLQQLNPAGTEYNMPVTMPADKQTDRKKLEDTFNKLIERHESLRTAFVVADDVPVQKIYDTAPFTMRSVKCTKAGLEQVRKDFIKPFALDQAPLIRAEYVEVEDGDDCLLIDMHHIITDGISHEVLEKDFADIYSGKKLSALPLQYKDYSEWQNSAGQFKRIEAQKKYWLSELSGTLPVISLPYDYERPAEDSNEGGFIRTLLNSEQFETIRAICREENVTVPMVLSSVLSILLSKLAGREQLLFGLSVSGRPHADLEKVIGMFVNSLVIRSNPSAQKTYTGFLRELKGTCIRAYENQEYQFNDLVDSLSVKRNLARNPLFDVMLNVLIPLESPAAGSAGRFDYYSGTRRFDLTLNVREHPDTVSITFQYWEKLFKRTTIERFAKYFLNIIDSLKEDRSREIGSIELLSANELNMFSVKLSSSRK